MSASSRSLGPFYGLAAAVGMLLGCSLALDFTECTANSDCMTAEGELRAEAAATSDAKRQAELLAKAEVKRLEKEAGNLKLQVVRAIAWADTLTGRSSLGPLAVVEHHSRSSTAPNSASW